MKNDKWRALSSSFERGGNPSYHTCFGGVLHGYVFANNSSTQNYASKTMWYSSRKKCLFRCNVHERIKFN
jgi:hypothetical protein